MFRFYELYSLYLKKMSSYGSSPTWCLCEKLPRSILHIAPTPEHWCEVCGRRRRPRACSSSSSDDEERAAERRQLLLAEQQRQEEARQGLVRVKVAMTAKKPKTRRKSNCFKCGGQQKQPVNLLYPQQQMKLKSNCNNNNRLYMGRFGHYRKPQRLQAKRRDEDYEMEPKEQLDIEPVPTAPPPPPSPPPSPPPAYGESLWEQFAQEVFNRPMHLRKRQPNFYDNLFVSDFLPLDKPITDAAGGAISKRRRLFGRPLRSHYSRPLPPLSQVLSEILAKQKVRAKGGGLPQKADDDKDSNAASQFSPFDSYEGPSEDALVVEGARQMLRQPKALHIKQRTDLPTTRLSSFESEASSDCSSSSPFDMPTAPIAERPRHSYSVGAPLRLHEMMKAVAQSGLSDSSASSSSTGSSSHKSASSTLPVLQQSVRSRGGEEPPYNEKPADTNVEPEMEPITIMEKILWLMDQKPAVDPNPSDHISPIDDKLEPNEIQDNHAESVKVLLHFMEGLHIEGGDKDDTHSALLKNDIEDELKTSVDTTPPKELQLSNDMSNEMPLNSTNKSTGDAEYLSGFSKVNAEDAKKTLMSDSGGTTNSTPNSSTSMWSMITGLFTSKRSSSRSPSTRSAASTEEMKPLKTTEKLHYGSIGPHRMKRELHSCRGKKSIDQKFPAKTTNSNCQKCGLSRPNNNGKSKNNSRFHSGYLSCSSSYHTAKTTQTTSNATKMDENIALDNLRKTNMNSFVDSQKFKDDKMWQRNAKNEIGKTGKRNQDMSNFKHAKKIKRTDKDDVTVTSRSSQATPHFIDAKKLQVNAKDEVTKIAATLQDILNSEDPKKFQCNDNYDSAESATSSRILTSVTPSSDELNPGPTRQDIQLKELFEKLRRRQPKIPTVLHMVKTIETVSFECGEIVKPKMVSSAREVGQLKQYMLKPMSLSKPFGLLEFRTPDVRKVGTNAMQMNEYENIEHSAQSKSTKQYEVSTISKVITPIPKRHQQPVWPAHPYRQRRRQIKYKAMQMELSYAVDDKSPDEDDNKRKNRKQNDRWLANELVQKKIHEMMTKPIKLLSFNEDTALKTL